jgi:zinc/manganese transport system permease protein
MVGLFEPFQWEFMRTAFAMAAVIGFGCAALGVWIVLRRLAYFGDAMGHAALPGIALAALAGAPLVAGAFGAALAMALLVHLLQHTRRVRSDSAIGIAQVGLFALGVVLIARSSGVRIDISHVLFGSITTVTRTDLTWVTVAMTIVVVTLVVNRRDMRIAALDPRWAASAGSRPAFLDGLQLMLLAIAVTAALGTVGVLMSIALFIVPPSAALYHARSTTAAMLTSGLLGTLGCTAGLIVSWHTATPPGATIALTLLVISALYILGGSVAWRAVGAAASAAGRQQRGS